MQPLPLGACTALALIASAAAQSIVSPVAAAAGDGSGSNAFPWTTATMLHYLQIHSDLGATPRLFKKLAGRMNGTATAYSGTRAIDMELYVGESVDWDKAQFVFANNWIGAKTQVVSRQILNFGPFTSGTPAPFEFGVPFPTPVLYTGTKSFAWEILTYSNIATGTAPGSTDIDSGSITAGTTAILGTGCVASGQTSAMVHTPSTSDVSGMFTMGFLVDFAPASAPAVLAIGSSNPNLSVPGLCGPLMTDLQVQIPIGISDASGLIGSLFNTSKYPHPSLVWTLPNTFPGITLYTQAHALDLASTSPLLVANSNGRSITTPVVNTTKTDKVTRVLNSITGPTSTAALYFNTSSFGYGAVTEFSY